MLAPDVGAALAPLAIAALAASGASSQAQAASASTRAAPAETVWLTKRAGLYSAPGAKPLAKLGPRTPYGSRTRLWVRERRPGWLKVTAQDGVRNTGWIAARRTRPARPIARRIVIDRSARRLTLFERGKRRLSTRVIVGAPGTPTPLGTFQVTDSLDGRRFGGTYGRWILVLSAYGTPAKTSRLAIHGIPPRAASSTGSAGCVRVPTAALERLRRAVAVGTPVTIKA
jgi:lipoprotein-anchoring transpeptidase ErfK/SrfK